MYFFFHHEFINEMKNKTNTKKNKKKQKTKIRTQRLKNSLVPNYNQKIIETDTFNT